MGDRSNKSKSILKFKELLHIAVALFALSNGTKVAPVCASPWPHGAPQTGTIPQSAVQTAPFAQGSQSGIVMLTPLPLLKKGSKGGAVWAMQTLLSDRGYGTQGVDSDFGANTESALKRFQTDFGLEADGECGCLSWEKLINGG